MWKACLLVVLLCGVAHAGENWMYIPADDKGPATCNKVGFTIDDLWNKFNLGIGECTLQTSRAVLTRGFFFDCASPTGKVGLAVFRSKKACMGQIAFSKTSVVAPLASLAPAGTKNTLSWAEMLASLFSQLPDATLQKAIDGKSLQLIGDLYDCVAGDLDKFLESRVRALVSKNPKITPEALQEQAKAIGADITHKCSEKVKPAAPQSE